MRKEAKELTEIERQKTTQDLQTEREKSLEEHILKVSEKIDLQEEKDENLDSIESIPFISEPIKKKSTRSKKSSV